MADLYAKRLESERKTLWATSRLKGLPSVSAERQRIAEIDRLLADHKAKATLSSPAVAGEGDRPTDGGGAPSARK